MKKPSYFEYFTQGDSQYLDWSWLGKEDYGWIDALNAERKIERDQAPGYGVTYFSSALDHLSKDFNSIDFPPSHEWPENFKKKYEETCDIKKIKITEAIEGAEQVISIGDITLYVACGDSHHYFSTKYYGHGSIELADIPSDSNFDSVDTAVYAFINDWNEWNVENGEEHRRKRVLSELDALREPVNVGESDEKTGCEHEDLGSLGYKHGAIVKCPYCKLPAEVW